MSKQVEDTQEVMKKLISRIETLEAKLSEKEKNEEESDKETVKKICDSLGDTFSKTFKETNRMISSFVDASAEGMKEIASAMSSLSEETDKEKLNEIPAAIVSITRKSMDIQKKAINKFEDSYKKYDDEDSDD